MLDIPTPYPVTPEWLSKAKLFLSEKWKERAKELKRPEPTDLSGACKFASLFGKEIFGLDIQGNWGHQFNVTLDGKPLDLLGGQTGDVNYLHDKKFFGNPEHSKSIESCKPRVMRWVEEFRQRYPLVSKIAASRRWSNPLLNGLKAEARKAPTFEDFKHDFSIDIKHGLYFHVTDNPNFTIDPAKGPRDMSSMGDGTPTPGKLMVTSHLENWTDYYESDRAYVAVIDMSEVPRESYHQVSRGFGNEFWVEAPQYAKVSAVMPVKEAIKLDRTYQNVLDLHSDEDLLEFYNQFHNPVAPEWKPPKEQGKLPFQGKGISVASYEPVDHNYETAPRLRGKWATPPTGNAVDDLGISGQQGWSYDEPFPDRGNDFYEDDQIQNPHSERPLTAALSPVYTEEVKKLEYGQEFNKSGNALLIPKTAAPLTIFDHVRHPSQLPSVEEFKQVSPDIRYAGIREFLNTLTEPLVIYRAIKMRDRYPITRGFGIYWTYDENSPRPYNAGVMESEVDMDEEEMKNVRHYPTYVFRGEVTFDAVDWGQTVWALRGQPDEKEITLRHDSPVHMTGWKRLGGFKWFKPKYEHVTAARRPKYPTYVPDTRTFSEAFKKWFEGSKVVDAYGKPLLVYHGSPDTRFLKEEGVFQTPTERFLHKEDPERAFWFAADYSTASSYADPYRATDYQGCEPGTKGFYLSIKNPYMVNKGGQSWHGTDTTIADAKAGGHDGIIIHNTVDTYQAKGLKTDTYAVFSPNQIKAADNIICDPISPNVNASKTAAQRRAFFHGTSIRNLRSILKQGLIPNPKERNWADDPDAGIRPSRESYGGVYVTTSLMTAISSPKDHNKEGREVVVCLSLQPSTFYLDEDDINFYVNEPFPSLSDSTNSFYALSTYLAMTLPNGSRWKEFGEGERQKYIDEVIRGLKFKWGHTEGEKTVMHPRLEEHLRSLLPAMWLASLARIASYIVFGPKRSDFDKREYDVAKAYLEVFPKTEWEAVPPMGKLFPSRQEGEGMYKEESERLTRALRLYARPHYEGGYRNTARVDTPIGYSGSNRITAVVEVRDGRQYLDDQPRDAEGSQTVEMVLHYGTALPQEFLTQWKERYGYKYTVTRSTESGKTAAEGFDPDYYMTEGCGIFAVALARLNQGVVYFMSDPEGDPWHNIGEMSPQQIEALEDSGSLIDWNMTHVYCMAPDGKTYDIKGQRSPAVMAKDFDMDPANPEVSLDGGPYQPDDFMNQFMGEMPEYAGEGERPLYGNEADVVEVTQYILKNPRKYGLTRKGR